MNESNGIDPSLPRPEELVRSNMYFVFSLILGLTCCLGFSVSHTIYSHVAPVWHSYNMLTDVCTCALPLFNWALAVASLANFSLYVFTRLRLWVLGEKTFYVVAMLTILIACSYIVNLLMAFYMTAGLLPL
jgi:hypothetical protein